jgi:purine-binding chemotaxis protein CheW
MDTKKIDGKTHHVNFKLGNDHFAITVMRVLEIIKNRNLTNIPNSSKYIKGVLNFRGEIVPVIDMYKRFNMGITESKNEMIIIVEMESGNSSVHIGLLVDEVMDIIGFEYKDIQKAPEMGISYDLNFLDGFVDIDSQFIMVLNIDKVINKGELAENLIAEIEVMNT